MVNSIWLCDRVECVRNARSSIFAECWAIRDINSDGASDSSDADNLVQLFIHDKEVSVDRRRIYLCEASLWEHTRIFVCMVSEPVVFVSNPVECDGVEPDNAGSIWRCLPVWISLHGSGI